MRHTIFVLLLSIPAVAQSAQDAAASLIRSDKTPTPRSVVRDFPEDWTLCAKPSPLRLNQGESVRLGQQTSPIIWGFSRDVQFQVCTLDGRPIKRQIRLILELEPMEGDIVAVKLATSEAISDSKGRLTATYGAGGLQPGAAWPEGTVSRERHRFVHEGKVVATFVLERSARNLTFSQALVISSRTEPSGNSTSRPSATTPASSFTARVSPER